MAKSSCGWSPLLVQQRKLKGKKTLGSSLLWWIIKVLGFRGCCMLERVSECSGADCRQFLPGQSDWTTSTRRWSKHDGLESHGQSLITVWSTRTVWNMQPLRRIHFFTLLLVLFFKHYICRVVSGSDCLKHHFLLSIPARRVFDVTLLLSWMQNCSVWMSSSGFCFFLIFFFGIWPSHHPMNFPGCIDNFWLVLELKYGQEGN